MTEEHDCGFPPGDTETGLLARRCSVCGEEWQCIHPRLMLWARKRDLHTTVGKHVQEMVQNPDYVDALELETDTPETGETK